MKDEYIQTHFQTVGKGRFPSLLKQLWTNDPTAMKTNMVKSFMKAGVFPLNPNAIDRSKIIQNNTNTSTPNVTTTSISNNQTATINNKSSQPTTNSSSFTSSHQAIAALNEILEKTKSNKNFVSEDSNDDQENSVEDEVNDEEDDGEADEDEDEDEGEEYLPSESNFTRSYSSSSSNGKQNTQSNKTITTENQHPFLLQQKKNRRNRKSSNIIGFNTSEEDSNCLCFITIVNNLFF